MAPSVGTIFIARMLSRALPDFSRDRREAADRTQHLKDDLDGMRDYMDETLAYRRRRLELKKMELKMELETLKMELEYQKKKLEVMKAGNAEAAMKTAEQKKDVEQKKDARKGCDVVRAFGNAWRKAVE